jgi:hypothetical protein
MLTGEIFSFSKYSETTTLYAFEYDNLVLIGLLWLSPLNAGHQMRLDSTGFNQIRICYTA